MLEVLSVQHTRYLHRLSLIQTRPSGLRIQQWNFLSLCVQCNCLPHATASKAESVNEPLNRYLQAKDLEHNWLSIQKYLQTNSPHLLWPDFLLLIQTSKDARVQRLWLSWQRGCFRYQRSAVRIQSLAKFIMNLFTVNC